MVGFRYITHGKETASYRLALGPKALHMRVLRVTTGVLGKATTHLQSGNDTNIAEDTPDAADPQAEPFESLEMNLAAARVYAVNSNAPAVFAPVGNARFLDAQGLDFSVVEAKASTEERPLLYHSFNISRLSETVPYTINGEQSWGVLQQIYDSFPNYIPKVVGTFVQRRINPTSDL
ncbi:unnamed protein product [Alternaria sp. RS040]